MKRKIIALLAISFLMLCATTNLDYSVSDGPKDIVPVETPEPRPI